MAGSIFTLLYMLSIYTIVDASSPPYSKRGYQDLTNHYQKRLRDPGKIVYETKSDSMQLYSIFAKRMVISQDKKDSTSMSWDDQEYELSVTSNKRRLNGKNGKFVTETVSYGKLKIRSLANNRYLCIKRDHKIHFEVNASRKNKPRKRCLFTWEFTNQMHIKLYVEKYGAKWYLTVTDDAVSLKKESGSIELQKSFIWIPAHSVKDKQANVWNSGWRNFDLSDENSSCGSRLETCKKNYGDCSSTMYIKKLKVKSLKDKNKMLQQQLEEVQRELEKLKKTEYVKSYTRS